MSSSSSAAGTAMKQSGPGEVSLHGPWLRILQGIWLLFVLIDLATLVIIYPRLYQGLYHVCNPSPTTDCSFDQLSSQALAALQRTGFSIESFALYVMAWDILTTCIFLLVGGLIFWRKPNTWMGIFVSFFLINLGSLGPSLTHANWLPQQGPLLIEIVGWGETVLAVLLYPTLAFFFFLYPDGRLVPRWSWTLISLWIVNAFFWVVPVASLNIASWHPLLVALWLFVVYGGSLSTQVYRYWRVASPVQRQQIKWLFYGYAPTFLVTIFASLSGLFLPSPGGSDSLLSLMFIPAYRLYYLPVPICVGIALLRYRLWDIDVLINRTLVYGSLTAILSGIYLLLVFSGQSLLVGVFGRNDPLILVASTLVVAALFQPLRRSVQQFVDRRFYRQKYDAARILAAFASTLHREIDLEQLNSHLLGVVKETMQPVHVSLWLCPRQRQAQAEDQQIEPVKAVLQRTGKL